MMESRIEEKSTAESISAYMNVLWHWLWLLVLLAIIAGGAVYFISSRGTKFYQSSTLVMIDQTASSQADAYYTVLLGQQMTSTYSKMMTTQPVLDGVAKRLGLASFPGTASIQVDAVPSTQLLTVTVQDIDPDRAALLANTLVKVFSEQIQTDQTSRYVGTEKSLQTQMDSINKQIQDNSNQITQLNQTNLQYQNDLVTLNNQIQVDTRASASADTINAEVSKRDQLQNTISMNQSQLNQLQTTQAQYQQSYNNLFQSLQVVKLDEAQNASAFVQKDPAVSNPVAIRPRPVLNAFLAVLVGLMIAVSVIILIEFLDDSIRDPQQITQKWGIPVLGMIVNFKTSKDGALITTRHPRSPVSEAFRSLRTNLQFASVDAPIRSLLVTSPSPSDGKTTIVGNLATVLAQGGRNVVVVDADLRRPSIHKIFQLSNRVGLSDQFIHSQERISGIAKITGTANLNAITSGNLPPNPSELLGSERMSEILHELGEQFNTVIIDTPPTLLVTDALVLGSLVDGVLLVVKPSVTKWAALRQVIEQMQHNKANLLGVVINNVNINRSGYYYYRGYYHHRYGKGYHYYSEQDVPEMASQPMAPSADTVVFKPSKTKGLKKEGKYEPE